MSASAISSLGDELGFNRSVAITLRYRGSGITALEMSPCLYLSLSYFYTHTQTQADVFALSVSLSYQGADPWRHMIVEFVP